MISPGERMILVVGYGNPGRQDDGLGPALAGYFEARALPGVRTDADYQLNLEHAVALAECDTVVFIDASRDAPPPFTFTRLEPAAEIAFSSHAVSPGGVLALAQTHFGHCPETWVLAVRGCSFDFSEGLTPQAREHATQAQTFLEDWITKRAGAQV
ncbi:MAG: hydrogenase maturation protease [Candidatus Hydrogenedentota bacterium]